jgi:trk system potassium uptake protein TrkA
MNFLIIGAGDVGKSLCRKLAAHHHNVVVVDRDSDINDSELAGLDLKIVLGNGCSPETLSAAGIESADFVIAVTDSDEVNIAACFVSRLLNPSPKRIARIRDLELTHRLVAPELLSEYFDLIINPEEAGAEYLLKLFKMPGAREFIDLAGGKVRVLGLSLTPNSPALQLTVAELHELYAEMALRVVAVLRGNKIFCPKTSEKLRVSDVIYVVTVPELTKKAFKVAGRELRDSQTAMIWGGSFLARSLALRLDEEGIRVKLILSDEEEQYAMADQLKHALVLGGEGTDQNLLVEENVDETDAFIAATEDEENNVLGALLAKKLGAKSAVALVSKSTYLPLVSAVGVDVVVSSRLAAASAIFRHIHSRSMLTEIAVQSDGGGFVEIDVSADRPIAGKLLSEIDLPYGVHVGAVLREGGALPVSPEIRFMEGDRVVFFVLKSSIKKLEKLLDLAIESF